MTILYVFVIGFSGFAVTGVHSSVATCEAAGTAIVVKLKAERIKDAVYICTEVEAKRK